MFGRNCFTIDTWSGAARGSWPSGGSDTCSPPQGPAGSRPPSWSPNGRASGYHSFQIVLYLSANKKQCQLMLLFFAKREVKHNGHICPQHLATKAGGQSRANFWTKYKWRHLFMGCGGSLVAHLTVILQSRVQIRHLSTCRNMPTWGWHCNCRLALKNLAEAQKYKKYIQI